MFGDTSFLASVFTIIVIDLALAGDNAVVIALAARRLPPDKRRKAILIGALGAIVVRVVLTAFVAQLLQVQLVKLTGGLVILWVAMKLFSPGHSDHGTLRAATSVAEAVKIIVVADISMGVDNMLAVGGASQGHLGLLLFGLGLSIPFLLFASDFLSRLMDRYPVIVYVGAAILGRVAGNMIMTDPTTVEWLAPPQWLVYAVEAVLAAGVVAAGLILQRRARRSARPSGRPEEVARGDAAGDPAAEQPNGSCTPPDAIVHSRPRIGSTERVQGEEA